MDSQHVRLLLHREVKYSSNRKVLSRLIELLNELFCYFENEKHDGVCKYLNNES